MSALAADRRVSVPAWSTAAAACACAAAALAVSLAAPGGPIPHPAVPLAAAQGAISAALGREIPAYRIVRLAARNPAQGFAARFSPTGVTVVSGRARIGLSLVGIGHGGTLGSVEDVSPRASGNRVSYAHGSVSEWWVNGPFGLEQGFDVAARPSPGAGPLTLSLALSGGLAARLERGSVSLSGRGAALTYGGLVATDARGRALRSWLELDGARVLVRIDDRGAAYPVHVDPALRQSATLDDAHGARLGQFGWSVAADGDTIVVGAPGDPGTGQRTLKGKAYVFTKPRSGWSGRLRQTGTLRASDGAIGDHFGWSVAVSGNTIVVGAPGKLRAPPEPPAPQNDAYVFVRPRGGWHGTHTETARLTTTSPVAGSFFGGAVGVSGGTVVVGAADRAVRGHVGQGQAFVFSRPRSGWHGRHAQTATLTSSNGAAHDVFGWIVAVSGDTIAVGAPQHRPAHRQSGGAAYMFRRPAGGWRHAHTETGTLKSPHTPGGIIGDSLALAGDTVVTGSGGAYIDEGLTGVSWVYVRPRSGWRGAHAPTARLEVPHRPANGSCGSPDDSAANSDFGFSLAMSGDTIVAATSSHGASGRDFKGTVCVFTKPPSGWSGALTKATTLIAGDTRSGDLFGTGSRSSVAVSGTAVVAGAANHRTRGRFGKAYVW